MINESGSDCNGIAQAIREEDCATFESLLQNQLVKLFTAMRLVKYVVSPCLVTPRRPTLIALQSDTISTCRLTRVRRLFIPVIVSLKKCRGHESY
jgi:hypothetical protein